MLNKLPEPKKDELTPHIEAREKLLQDHFVEDPDLSKRYLIIEHNLEVIENLEKLLTEVVEMSSEGIEKKSLEDKNLIFNKIRNLITKETSTD
ncbi:MAG: hypothetical protein HeimC2_13700 [Candidatus Heimdallarchaeota archaeon LC_2]|nr:MAG: hypothetical protein HeimC2_13700 [Candidatus Heimdallarchaeota archaeon LC_2]